MFEFARYYIDFIKELFSNIGKFFGRIFQAFADLFFNDIVNYFNSFAAQSKYFNGLDWIASIFVILINTAFITFLVIRLYQLLKKYIKFVRTEVEKEYLLEEVALLSQRAVELTDEKNKILALKMESFGMNPDLFQAKDENAEAEVKAQVPSRFVKLIAVDEQYKGAVTTVTMPESDLVTLPELVDRFINFAAYKLKLYYNKKVVATYFAGMATSKILILEGISGTGKTSLPYAMGKFFNNDSAIVSVQPSWRDRSEMIGYLNEFTKKFNETDFLKELYETTYREDLNFIVLDELNLARIEYYFAEFLSVMEMPNTADWKIDIVPDTQPGDPKHLIEGKITLPQNVWFIGTANKDDSTFTITDKVYDRATSIEMNSRAEYVDAPPTNNITMSYDYLEKLFKEAHQNHPLSPSALVNLDKLDQFIAKKFKITFGNRIMKQIKLFVPVFVACGGNETEGLDYIVTRKILRKFESLNLPFLQDELQELLVLLDKLFGKGQFAEAINFINDLRKQI
ncbi:hypothetical protein [Acholeplasma hippikon]|uniref:5-methylcytosine-specific restriction enzyme B n=1 Tax=Acholeplasma hippikon TaxID=264636 RepID=A0A449BLM8_9MOLU|nr:hypothetical protein [Acholeplasma hippikon]VEU83328.1 Uncharacterised protein [Acholeplasma hippikon]